MIPQRENSSRFRRRALSHLRRLSVNAALQIGGQVFPLLAGAAAIPVVYRHLGHADFGIFTIGLSALGLISLIDLGLGRASVLFAARSFADGNPAAAASVVVNSAAYVGGFSLVLCLALIIGAPAIAARWIQSQPAEHEIVRQCLCVLAAAVPFGGLTSVFRSVLEAREDFRRISLIQSTFGTLTYVVPSLLSFATADIRVIIGGAVICKIIAAAVFAASALRAWPDGFPWSSINLRAQREFRQFSFWSITSNVVGAGIMYGDRVLLVRMFGLGEIPFYNIPLEMLGRMMIAVNSAATVIFPSLSRLSGNRVLIEDVYVALVTLLSAIMGAALLGLSIATPFCLDVWLGGQFREHSTLVVRVLLVGMAFQCLNVFALATLNARGFARPITLMHLLEVPFYFAALYSCGEHFGLVGVALVWSCRLIAEYCCFCGFQVHLSKGHGARRQRIGLVLAACNALPVALMTQTVGTALAVLVCIVCMTASAAWALLELREVQKGSSIVPGT